MVDEQPDAGRKELQQGLDRAADDGWPAEGGGEAGSTNPAEQARRAIALLRAWHEAQPDGGSGYQTIIRYVDHVSSPEAQLHELARVLQGMTALADFLLANLERATGRDGEAFLESVSEQAGQYFPN